MLPPDGDGPFPLVLLQHGLGGSADAPYIDAAGCPWARRGAAVACVDLPLHGSREDQKLAALLPVGLARPGISRSLALEFAQQAVCDLARTLDALCAQPMLDAGRVAFAGFSLGAMLGACFCALDPRPRAAALALAGAGVVPPGADAAEYVAAIAPRPVLLVNAEADTVVPREAALALFRAAAEPKQQLWFDADHETLPGEALKAMWRLLSESLGL